MRDRDRLWWLLLLAGVAFAVFGVAGPYWELQSIWGDPYITSGDYPEFIGLAGLLALVGLGGGVTFAVMAVTARRHHRRRLAALRGDARAMPLADIQPNPARAPDTSGGPFHLQWRLSKGMGVMYGAFVCLYGLMVLVAVGASLFSQLAPLLTPNTPLTASQSAAFAGEAGVTFALIVALVYLMVRATPFLLGRPFGLTVTDAGIEARTELGTHVRMTWDEMRLLEVQSGDASIQRRFDLYAPGKQIVWTIYRTGFGAQYAPIGATPSEMTMRQEALLALIVARAGLTPRTLTKALERKPETTRRARRSSGVVGMLVLALLLAGLGAAEYVLPTTPVVWVNWASMGSLALISLCLLAIIPWSLIRRRTRKTPGVLEAPPSAGAPALAGPESGYVLAWRTPLLARLIVIAVGFVLGVNLIPGVWTIVRQVQLVLPGTHSDLLAVGAFTFIASFMIGLVLGLLGFGGLAFAYGGMIARTVTIRADTNGLTTGRRGRERLLPWSSVRDVSWVPDRGGRGTYLVTSDDPLQQVTWPADPRTVVAASTATSAGLPIGPDELAALVAAQSGKPVRVRES